MIPAAGGDQAMLGQHADSLVGLAEEFRDLGGGEPGVVGRRLHSPMVAVTVR